MTSIGVLTVHERQARVAAADASAALESVSGLTAVQAVAKLRLGPGRTCEPVARLIDKALARAGRAGLGAEQLVVLGGTAETAEDIVRVRRKAHGKADWISSPTSDVRIELRPAGLHGLPGDVAAEPAPREEAPPAPPAAGPPDIRAVAVRDALYQVIDPDLGVNIVDLGFVRDIQVAAGGDAIITMTLTSAACPLTQVMRDQIRTVLLEESRLVTDFHIEWSWLPAWRPADISEDGRDQLRAIGFTHF
ncbi:metal-sulfur cluster assembly factor [Streptomyces sp. RB6PN25]|uniref:50S ribosomal protein L22 n=1 Tax=Streptomyces humicola TaxID=2953240 RepID=A0ABT1Q2G6_9ACTN|nr:iron-sulfur cluster assembly protein [Streptomyces humicola]MCQ4084117.1 metal-sulfur cluster assembly factor [Streptomyces humicola]